MIPRFMLVTLVVASLLAAPAAADQSIDISVSATDRADQGARVPVQVSVFGSGTFERIEVVLDSSHTTVTVNATRERAGLYTATVPTADIDPGAYQLFAQAIDGNDQEVASSEKNDFQLYATDQGDATSGDVNRTSTSEPVTPAPEQSTTETVSTTAEPASTTTDAPLETESGVSTEKMEAATISDSLPAVSGTNGVIVAIGVVLAGAVIAVGYLRRRD